MRRGWGFSSRGWIQTRTPTANTYSEMWTTIDRIPTLHVDFARKWIGECQTKHDLCTSNFLCSARSERPTRLACHATAVEIKSCEFKFFGRPRRVKCLGKIKGASPNPKRSYTVDFVPLEDDQTCDDRNDNNQRPEESNHVVASGSFDVVSERVSSCWCLPLTKTEGLILSRDDRDKFRRLGKVKIHELGWMIPTEEVEVCLV
ncbi:hypothetical protein GGR55DRAFT_670893 [Xylaria sp. FL0064]|nr:hypothetical protein GGR55DRAFT_670893 [Xylaria sp. FL0064]